MLQSGDSDYSEIQRRVRELGALDKFSCTTHAYEEMRNDGVTRSHLKHVLRNAEIRPDRTRDDPKFGRSYAVEGRTWEGVLLRIVVTLREANKLVIVTVMDLKR